MQEELEMLKELLKSERQTLSDLTCDYDKVKALCDEKDSALQVISCELADTSTFFLINADCGTAGPIIHLYP